jgi:hypothetical protein
MKSVSKSVPSSKERNLSLFLVGVLVLIGVLMIVLQTRYDPSMWRLQSRSRDDAVVEQQTDSLPVTSDVAIEGLTPLSPPETYQTNNLSDKIDGKAELYLEAGFRRLQSRRFGLSGQPDQWMESYIYDMGQIRGAFAVFSAQRRSKVRPLEVTPHAYQAGNGLFFVHGRYYVEIIAAQLSENMQTKMQAMAQAFVAAQQVNAQPLEALSHFPTCNLVPHSQTLVANSAFGLDRLNWIYTARYEKDQVEGVAFLSKRSSALEAAELANAFRDYWMDYGGEALDAPSAPPDLQVVSILDSYEIVWVQDTYLIGVHEASTLDFGIELAGQLQRTIARTAP